MTTTLPTLATIARDALADMLTLSHYCDTRDARRVADDLTEQLRTLKAYARTYSGDTEAGIWSAMKFGYISDTLADELVNVAAGGECSAAVERAFREECEGRGLDEPAEVFADIPGHSTAGGGVATTGTDPGARGEAVPDDFPPTTATRA